MDLEHRGMISVRQLHKTFKLYRRPSDRMLEWFLPVRRHESFHALRDVNLEIPAGRTLGIVGANGAGKSTLLKLITGVLLPTKGEVEVKGRVAALLELGTGFHPEFTGRQNIHVNGQLLGISPEEMLALEPEIIAFSELGAFIDQPIRTYSSGMYLRLGFSIAACVQPEILIVDEALSVGDARFSQKCIRRIREFRDHGATILFVSHDPGAVSLLCDEAVLLDRGMVRASGTPKDILDEYNALLAAQGTGNSEMTISRPVRLGGVAQPRRHGTFQALIHELVLMDAAGSETTVFAPGDEVTIRLRAMFLTPVRDPTVGISIRDRLGQDLYGTNTALKRVALGEFAPGDVALVEVRLRIPFGFGDYSLTVAIHDDENHLESCYEWTDNAAIFSIRLREKLDWSGLVELQPSFTHRREKPDGSVLAAALRTRFGDLPFVLDAGAERSPSPFLHGCAPPADFAFGRGRLLEGRASLVARLGDGARCSLATTDGEPGEVTLSLPHHDWQTILRVEGVPRELELALPDGLSGPQLVVLDCPRPLVLLRIATNPSPADSPHA